MCDFISFARSFLKIRCNLNGIRLHCRRVQIRTMDVWKSIVCGKQVIITKSWISTFSSSNNIPPHQHMVFHPFCSFRSVSFHYTFFHEKKIKILLFVFVYACGDTDKNSAFVWKMCTMFSVRCRCLAWIWLFFLSERHSHAST